MGIRSELGEKFDFDIIDEFLDHYSLMIDSMEIMIIDLSKPEMYHRSLDELFRVFHNIKAATAYLGLEKMRRLATLAEGILEDIRHTNRAIGEDSINWFLAIKDMFAQWNEDFKLDHDLSKMKFSLLKIPDVEKQ